MNMGVINNQMVLMNKLFKKYGFYNLSIKECKSREYGNAVGIFEKPAVGRAVRIMEAPTPVSCLEGLINFSAGTEREKLLILYNELLNSMR